MNSQLVLHLHIVGLSCQWAGNCDAADRRFPFRSQRARTINNTCAQMIWARRLLTTFVEAVDAADLVAASRNSRSADWNPKKMETFGNMYQMLAPFSTLQDGKLWKQSNSVSNDLVAPTCKPNWILHTDGEETYTLTAWEDTSRRREHFNVLEIGIQRIVSDCRGL